MSAPRAGLRQLWRAGRSSRVWLRAASTSATSGASARRVVGAGVFGLGLAVSGVAAQWWHTHEAEAAASENPPKVPTEEEWKAGIAKQHGSMLLSMFDSEAAQEQLPKVTKFYPFLIISHPRAVVTQSALSVITDVHPDAEILIVSDKYNFDDDNGNRIYSGSFARTTSSCINPGRLNISPFSTSKSKLDEELLMPLSNKTHSKGVNMCSNAYAVRLDVRNKLVHLSDGRVFAFGKCLLATGCREAKLPGIPPGLQQHVTNLRKVKDFDKIQTLVREGRIKNIVIVGGGFLGCQVAAKLADQGKAKHVEVIHAYVEPGALYRYVPTYFSDYVTERLREMGVSERPYHMVLNIKEPADRTHNLQLALQGFEKATIQCGHVVFAPTHLEGNVELAQQAGLEIDTHCGGVMVNSELLARSDIYVAGDTASYPDTMLGRRRMQSYDHSYHSGAVAAYNMATGSREAYNHLPVITSSGGPMAMEVVVLGDIDSNVEMYSVYQTDKPTGGDGDVPGWEQWEKGIVYYLKNKKVVGAMLLNLSGRTDDVRQLIRSGLSYTQRSGEEIKELSNAIDLGLEKPTYRHSAARGSGLSRFHTTHQ